MAHIVEVPGHGEFEFPDSMSNEDIATAIKKIFVPPVAGMERLGALPGIGNPARSNDVVQPWEYEDNFWTSPNGLIRSGGRQVAAGAAAMTRPTADEKMGALSTMIRGAGTMATPAMIPLALANPVKGVSGLMAGFTGGKAAKGTAYMLGAGEGAQNLAEDAGNLLAGGYAADKAPGGWSPLVNAGSDAKAAVAGFADPKPKLSQTSGGGGLGSVSPFELRHAATHPATGVPLILAHAFTKGRWSGAADAVRTNRIQRMPLDEPLGGHEFAPEATPIIERFTPSKAKEIKDAQALFEARAGKPLRPPLAAPPSDLPVTGGLMENFTEPVKPADLQAALEGRNQRIAEVQAKRSTPQPPRQPLSAPPADIQPSRSLMENFKDEPDIEGARAYMAENLAARQKANPQSPMNIVERLKAPVEETPSAAAPTEKAFEYPDYADLYKDSTGAHHPAAPSAFRVDKDVIKRAEQLGLTPDALAKGNPAQFEQLYKDTNHPKSFKSLIENGDRLQMLLKTWRRFRGEE